MVFFYCYLGITICIFVYLSSLINNKWSDIQQMGKSLNMDMKNITPKDGLNACLIISLFWPVIIIGIFISHMFRK